MGRSSSSSSNLCPKMPRLLLSSTSSVAHQWRRSYFVQRAPQSRHYRPQTTAPLLPPYLLPPLLAFSCRTVLPSPSLTRDFRPFLPKVSPRHCRRHPLPTAAVTTVAAVLELGKDAELYNEEEVSRTRMFGQVVEVELSMYSKNRNRGLAFVEMGSEEDASQVLKALEASEFEGRTLKINYAKPKKKPTPSPARSGLPPTFNLFVSKLSYEARAIDLSEFFKSEIESVASADIIFRNNPRRSSGYLCGGH